MTLKCVIYTDGSARPNPGNIGWGAHGYLYQNITSKPISISKHIITNEGYLYPEKFKNTTKPVEPIEYIDIVGSKDTPCGTNNQAEIQAILTTLNALLDKGIEDLYIISDSEYCINIATEYLKTNKKTSYSANMELWLNLYKALDKYTEKNIKVSFNWIKGHSDNVGNDTADYLSVIGTNHSRDEKEILDIQFNPTKKYWEPPVNDNPLLSFNRCYFNTFKRFNILGQYFIADPGPNEMLIGKRIAETGLAVIKLKEPDPIIEDIKSRQYEVAADTGNIAMINLAKMYTPSVYKYLSKYGKYCLNKNKRFNSLDFIDNKPITIEITPVGLSLRAIEAFNTLEDILDNYDNNPHIEAIDITDHLYELEVKKKSTNLILKKDIDTSYKNLNVTYTLDNKAIKIPLMLNVDLPNRNKLKKLESYNPKVKLIIWSKQPTSFRYCCLIESDIGTGVWSNYYADRIFNL
jgi:ribonuclease HI